jgi:hypothetical protein
VLPEQKQKAAKWCDRQQCGSGQSAALAPAHNAMLMQAKQVVEVTWEDQQSINSFGKLNTDFQTVKARLENHKVRC